MPLHPWFQVDQTDWTLYELDIDTDLDGCFNSEDDDDDGDSIPDTQDACPIGMMTGGDLDGDGCKDAEDDDIDGDGYPTEYESDCGSSDLDSSSIPVGPQWDNDNDQVCDAVDTDDDNDGVPDNQDAFPLDSSEQSDYDLDGVGDNLTTTTTTMESPIRLMPSHLMLRIRTPMVMVLAITKTSMMTTITGMILLKLSARQTHPMLQTDLLTLTVTSYAI